VERPDQSMRTARSQAERVYGELRAQLLRGELPAGARLGEERLAAEFDTSRTPVREALRRLEGDGHLVRGPGAGLYPNAPNVASMAHLYDVRLAIEELSVRRAAGDGDTARLEAVRDEWLGYAEGFSAAALRGPDFVHADETFHQSLAEASGNPIAEQVLRDVNARIRLLRIHDFTSEDRIRATIAEHLEIIDATLSGDAEASVAFMRAHVQRSAIVVRERVNQAVARMSATADGSSRA
jgi:DNA-binding GntR family transcriptional regulator